MVAIKSHQADSYLQKLPSDQLAYLIYGSDEGRVSESAHLLAKNWSEKYGDGGELITIDERSLADNPDILSIEIGSIPMFGGRSVVRLKANPKIKPALIGELLALEPQNLLIIEAGNLTPSSALRKLFEKAPNASAIACFPDETRDIARLIEEELTSKGISVSPAGKKLLTTSLGTDRGVSRMELQKLALYAHERSMIDVDDILACVGDSSQLAYDTLVSLTLDGNGPAALSKLDRLMASGQSCAGFNTVLGRHLQRLYKVRSMVDAGREPKDAVQALRPPVHFKQRDAVIAQSTRLTPKALKKAIHLVAETVQRCRLQSDLETVHTERLIMQLSYIAKSPQR
jgi:DNA polymerase-3 subunit delta